MMARDELSWLIAAVLVLPLSWTVFAVNGKPVDIIPSDLLWIALPVLAVGWRCGVGTITGLGEGEAVWLSRAVTALVAYSGLCALIRWMQTGDVLSVLSAIKFVKPLLFVYLGIWLAAAINPLVMLRRIAWAFAVTMLLLALSTVANPDPGRVAWGSQWLGQPVYGFPNLGMSFAGAMLPLLLAVTETSRLTWQRWLTAAAVGSAFVLVVCSLSRCATVVMLSGLSVYFLLTGRRWIPIGFAAVAVVSVGTGYSLLVLQSDTAADHQPLLQERAAHRFVAPINQDSGALAGRSTIWAEATMLISARPLLGYGFEPYAAHSEFSSPHQQYLEVLYKTGAVGGVLYLSVLGIALVGLVRLWHREESVAETRPLMAAAIALLIGLLIGNLSQSNLTYSLSGNALFMIVGLLVSPRDTGSEIISEMENSRSVLRVGEDRISRHAA